MRQLRGLELLGAKAGSSQENRTASRSRDGGVTALMGCEQFSESGKPWCVGLSRP